jgi:hypothetical protein
MDCDQSRVTRYHWHTRKRRISAEQLATSGIIGNQSAESTRTRLLHECRADSVSPEAAMLGSRTMMPSSLRVKSRKSTAPQSVPKLLCELGFSLAFEKGEWQQRSQSRGPHWLQAGFGLSSAMMQIPALQPHHAQRIAP